MKHETKNTPDVAGGEDFKFKKVKNKLAQNIHRVIPMVEEITKRNLMPLCLIGFNAPNKSGKVEVYFSTLSHDKTTELVLIEVCGQLVKSKQPLPPQGEDAIQDDKKEIERLKGLIEIGYKRGFAKPTPMYESDWEEFKIKNNL